MDRLALPSIMRLARGTVPAQIITLASVPLLARLLPAEAFGLFGMVSAAGVSLSVVVTARYELGIIPARDATDAAALAWLAACAALAASAVIGLLLALAGGRLDAWTGVPGLTAVAWLLPFGIAVQAWVLTGLQWAAREHRDAAMVRLYTVRAGSTAALQTLGATLGAGALGLAGGQVAGAALGLLALLGGVRMPPAPRGRDGRQRLVAAARRHASLALFGTPRVLLEAVSRIGLIGLIAALFGAQQTGLYWMAARILSVPGALLDEPVRQVAFRNTAEAQRRGESPEKPAAAAMFGLVAVGLLGVVTLHFAADALCLLVLGAEWLPAAAYLRALSFAWAAGLASIPLSGLAIVLGCQRSHLLFEVVLQAARLGCILGGHKAGSFLLGLQLLAAFEILYVIAFAAFLFTRKGRGAAVAHGLAKPAASVPGGGA